MLDKTGYSIAGERVRMSRVKLGKMRVMYDGGAKSWNNRIRAIITYVSSGSRGIYRV